MKSKRMKTRGLVLGKFAPLHKGHQYLIETALREMDEVIVLVYDCPETTDVLLEVRSGWIRTLYPEVKVVEGRNGPTETGYTERIKKLNEDYVLGKIKMPITHFFSNEPYGEHMSQALGCKNRVVDLDRKKFPVSGTSIRNNPDRYKKYMEPIVYKDLIKKVVFLGAESTGKSTLTEKLAEVFSTNWMPEYGREYWEKNNVAGKLTPKQLVALAEEHLKREDAMLPQAQNYLFVDTNAITTEMFSRYYHGFANPKLIRLAWEAEKRYAQYFVCDTDIPYDEDGTRSGEKQRQIFQRQIIKDLESRGVEYILLRGDLDSRIAKVISVLIDRGWPRIGGKSDVIL